MKNRNSLNENPMSNRALDREGRNIHSGTPAQQHVRRDVSEAKKQDQQMKHKKRVADLDVTDDIKGSVGSRKTGSSPDDIAGVADIDRDLKR